MPAASDQALLGALYRRDRTGRLCRTGARGARIPLRQEPCGEANCWRRRWRRRPQTLDFERAAIYRDRLAALSAIQSQQGVNLRGVDDADVFAIHQAGGYNCVQVFFFRTGQNWGNRAYFPKADRDRSADDVLNAFIAQFYDDKPCPRTILVSEELPERALLAEALSTKSGHSVEVSRPKRGEKRDVVEHALANAREALGRKLAETSSQQALLKSFAELFGLPALPRRIEVYDNSHIQGSNAVGAMIVAGPDGFVKNQYRKFNIRSDDLTPGDDFGMMREVLERRFKRLLNEHPRNAAADAAILGEPLAAGAAAVLGEADTPWPDLVLIDGGLGQLIVRARDVRSNSASPMCHWSRSPRARIATPDAKPFSWTAANRSGCRRAIRLLYFIERLRDEAHRFAIGSHRTRRKRDIREGGLQEIPGIGPTRKRALLHHFGTLKAIERASLGDLAKVPGVNADTARRIYDFFHERPT